jgi:nitrate/TMAO reductase-like tetraheme cytochrome c subunit
MDSQSEALRFLLRMTFGKVVIRNMQNKYALPVLALAIVAAATVGIVSTSAQEATDSGKTIVQRLSEKFNLKESDVQAVFSEHKAEHHVAMQQKIDARLSQAVIDGKITAEQKQRILDKHKELREKMESNLERFKDMTHEERRAEMEKQHAELEQWAKDNGIDEHYLFMGGVKMHLKHGGPHPGFMMKTL